MGYQGVRVEGSRYKAYAQRAGKQVHLGLFATAEEAALAVARFKAPATPKSPSPAPSPPLCYPWSRFPPLPLCGAYPIMSCMGGFQFVSSRGCSWSDGMMMFLVEDSSHLPRCP